MENKRKDRWCKDKDFLYSEAIFRCFLAKNIPKKARNTQFPAFFIKEMKEFQLTILFHYFIF